MNEQTMAELLKKTEDLKLDEWEAPAECDAIEKPSDGFELVKTSKWSLILCPLMALSGWLILIWLISRR
jgi:hypothetical protein